MIKEIDDPRMKERIAKRVLNDLPEWFGIPENTRAYIKNSRTMPFFAISVDEEAVGFVSLKETSRHAAEIHCIGILKKYHRSGYGKRLFAAFEDYAIRKGYRLLQVKTLKAGTNEDYDRTHAFYRSLGFLDLEVFPTLWDAHNPCQVMIKPL